MKIIITKGTPISAGFKGEVVYIDEVTLCLLCFNNAMVKHLNGNTADAVFLLHMGIYRFRTLTRKEQEFLVNRRIEAVQLVQKFEDETG